MNAFCICNICFSISATVGTLVCDTACVHNTHLHAHFCVCVYGKICLFAWTQFQRMYRMSKNPEPNALQLKVEHEMTSTLHSRRTDKCFTTYQHLINFK